MNLPLKIAIVESGKTQTAIAKQAGLHESRLSRLVHEHDMPTDEEARSIARVLKRPVAELFIEAA